MADKNTDIDLREDVRQLREDLARLTKDLGGAARSRASAVRDRVEDRTQEACDSARELVADRPLTSVLAAVGVGALVGLILGRSGK